jgi:hypothetical protein
VEDELFPRPSASLRLLWRFAACRGEEPALFDQTDPVLAEPALKICRSCPVQELCLKEMAPQEHWYDGVVSNVVWLDGLPVGGDTRKILSRRYLRSTLLEMTPLGGAERVALKHEMSQEVSNDSTEG